MGAAPVGRLCRMAARQRAGPAAQRSQPTRSRRFVPSPSPAHRSNCSPRRAAAAWRSLLRSCKTERQFCDHRPAAFICRCCRSRRRHLSVRAPTSVAVDGRFVGNALSFGAARAALGIDCSGLVQVSLWRLPGSRRPGTASMQEAALGKAIPSALAEWRSTQAWRSDFLERSRRHRPRSRHHRSRQCPSYGGCDEAEQGVMRSNHRMPKYTRHRARS